MNDLGLMIKKEFPQVKFTYEVKYDQWGAPMIIELTFTDVRLKQALQTYLEKAKYCRYIWKTELSDFIGSDDFCGHINIYKCEVWL